MITPRQTIAMCSPGLAVLVASLGWWALDRLVTAGPRRLLKL